MRPLQGRRFNGYQIGIQMTHSWIRKKINILNIDNIRIELGHILLISLSLCLGIWIRLKGLGKWPFDFDEYYMAKSVQNILDHGVPRFDSGGYYVRGVLIQYLSAPLLLLNIKPEFALRLIPVIFNLLAFPALYLLGKKVSGKHLATALIIVFSLSLWEIEFSRYARMYMPFQTIFLWYVLFLYNIVVEGHGRYHKWLYALSFISIFTYEGSIFLVLLNFLPLILNKKKINIYDLFYSFAILSFAAFYLSIDFAHLWATNNYPIEIMEPRRRIDTPPVLFVLTLNSIWSYLFLIPVGFSLFVAAKIIRANEFRILTKLALIITIILSLTNLIALAIYLLFVAFLFNYLSIRDFKNANIRWCLLVLFISFAFWIVYGFSTDVWLHAFQEYETTFLFKLQKIFVALLEYPNILNKILELYFGVAPVFSTLTMLFIGIGILRIFTKSYEETKGFRVLLAILVILGNAVAVLNIPWKTTRYTFFLYPVLLLMILASVDIVIRSIAKNKRFVVGMFSIIAGLFLFISEDFNIHHFTNIDSKEVNFRVNYGISSPMAIHLIPRRDVSGTANYVKNNMEEHDEILTTFYHIEYYLNGVDYFYQGLGGPEAREYAALGGTKEKWMNANLIQDEKELFQMLENPNNNLWVIINSSQYRENRIEMKIARQIEDALLYQSFEGGIKVYRIPKQNSG